MKKDRAFDLAIAGYFLVAVITWGNAYQHFEGKWQEKVASCKASRGSYCEAFSTTGHITILSSLFWPAYFSYRLWDGAE